ncbi:hypothetical protein Agabi119p4_1037 [Agaricus bisporus var. burnettii]|uniref:Uncharacterized protein n=1 Tax=Agaricus bisporus var. burnettii TaxID=192524 RepID=A0A8H7KLL8_AGABI|nr:hypothetical protein Agabi119p4_1037 [Agaricus bisporus var. burnettii]
MKAHHSILFLLLSSHGAFSATITLYEVAVPTPTVTDISPHISQGISITVSPVGVGEDGKTTYVAEGVRTELAGVFPDTTTTFSSPSATFTNTFVEDASGLFFKQTLIYTDGAISDGSDFQNIQSCNFQGTTAGSCVRRLKFPEDTGTSTTTYSGTLIPVYTLTETANIPGQTQDSRALPHSNIWDTYQLIGLILGMSVMMLVF